MSEAQVQSTDDGAILFDAAACGAERPDARWFDAAHWSARGGATAHRGGRGGVAFVETPAGACVLRHYRRGGVAARFSRDRYFFTGARRTRGFREFAMLERLVEWRLPVPAPIAARYVRRGLAYSADLIVRRIPNTDTLAARLSQGPLDARVGERVGATIAQFHAAGACHADLNAHNILLDARDVVSIIDFDRGTLRAPAFGWQQSNLARLRRSLAKLGATKRDAGFDTRFWHPLLGAYHATLAGDVAANVRGAGG
jgi:3-deoxy-D-manno-octulosonic acid kinase